MMVQDLKSFLQGCAERDLSALHALQDQAASFSYGKKVFGDSAAYKEGRTPNLKVPLQVLTTAVITSLCKAGEAAKTIERTRPEIIAAYPNYPWRELKQIRDLFSHHTREGLDETQFAPIMVKLQKAADHLLLAPASERLPFDRAFDEINNGMVIAHTLLLIGRCTTDKAMITLSDDNPSVQFVAKQFPSIARNLPTIVPHYHMHNALIGIGDAIEYLSVFFREGEKLPIDPVPILSARNRAAHFATAPSAISPGTGRNVYQEFLDLEANLAPVWRSLYKNLPKKEDTETTQAFCAQYAAIYYHEIMEKIGHDDAKRELLDRTVQFITKTQKNGLPLRNATVMAMANFLETATAQQGQEILDYLTNKSGALRDPKKMRREIAGIPHGSRIQLDRFLGDVEKLSQRLGEGLGRES